MSPDDLEHDLELTRPVAELRAMALDRARYHRRRRRTGRLAAFAGAVATAGMVAVAVVGGVSPTEVDTGLDPADAPATTVVEVATSLPGSSTPPTGATAPTGAGLGGTTPLPVPGGGPTAPTVVAPPTLVPSPTTVPAAPYLVAFTRETPDGSVIAVVADDGGEPTILSSDAALSDKEPAFSPDGTRLAFASLRGNALTGIVSVFDIWVVDLGTGTVRRISTIVQPNGCTSPSWSPDGSMLAFACDDAEGLGQLWTARADGTDVRQRTSGATSRIVPRWTADGRALVHLRDVGTAGFALSVLDLDQGTVRDVGGQPTTLLPQYALDAAGARIAYTRMVDGHVHVFVAAFDGLPGVDVTGTLVDASRPAFTPDGTRLVVNATDGAGASYLAELDVATGASRRLLVTPAGLLDTFAATTAR